MPDITPNLGAKSNNPLYLRLYEFLKREIRDGKIRANTRLPPIRKLASYLGISRNTVEKAYHQLIAEGYINSLPRSGIYVMELEKEIKVPRRNTQWVKPKEKKLSPPEFDFRFGNVDVEYFPFSIWRKLTNYCMNKNQKELFSYGDNQGEYELRREIKEYLYYSRGVVCEPEQIIIGAGIQQSISLLLQILGLRNHSFAIEEPGYDGVKAIFKNHLCRLDAVPIAEDGINIDSLYDTGADTVYVTPSHQFPLGMIMPYNKRIQPQWAEEREGIIIEDDYDSEFRYMGNPVPSLQGLDKNNRVVYVGTFSKSLIPSIRISYMVLPVSLAEKYQLEFSSYQRPVSRIHQKTLALFMEGGYWERHLRKMRTVYQKKHTALLRAVKEKLTGNVEVVGSGAGLHILLQVYTDKNESELIREARAIGVKVYPTSKFWMTGSTNPWPMIQIGFGGLSETDIHQGIELLNEAWFSN